MRYLALGTLACVLFLSSCTKKNDRLQNWVLKKEAIWLVLQTDYTRTIVTQSTLEESGTENNNGVLAFTSTTEGNFELVVPFVEGNWLRDFEWSVDEDTIRGGYPAAIQDTLGGTSDLTFKAYEISKKQMRMEMLHLFTNLNESITTEMVLNMQRRK